jgi:tetratricopeptide (TPR) repeat protein
LHVLLEGKRLLLRRGDAVFEANGQLRIDFERTTHDEAADEETEATLLLPDRGGSSAPTAAALETEAQEAEDDGDYQRAVEAYRALLAVEGPSPAVNFRLADALYRAGDYAAARERYYVAIELDEDFVEARANLGCLLAELSDHEHAIAAFEGALALYPEYADVHYHLGQLLLDQGQVEQGRAHLESFLSLAPESPWADEVADRLAPRTPARAGETG